MAVHASHAALPYPVKGARFSVLVPYLDADGDPTAPATPDTEISKDNGAAADCAEEVSATSGMDGMGLLTLSGAETNCSCLALNAKVASGPKATLLMLSPRVLPVLYSGTAAAGAAGTLTLASDIPAITSLLLGCILKTTGGTGGGGTGGANNQARVITGFTSGRVASVTPDWETTPDATTTYEVLLTEQALLRMADIRLVAGAAPSIGNTLPAAQPLAQLMILDDGTAFALFSASASLYFRIFDNAGLAWDFTAKAFVALTSTANDYLAATARTNVGGTGLSGYSATLPISELHTGGTAKGLVLVAYNNAAPADADVAVLPPVEFSVQFGQLGDHPLTVQADVSVKSTEGNTAQLKVWLDRDGERMPVSTAGGATFTADAGTDVCTSSSHGLANGDVLLLTTSNTLPGGLAVETPYFVRDVTTHTFKLAATSGGSAINITSTGTGTHKWHNPTARIRLREHGANDATFLFDEEFTAEHLVDDCFELELADPNFTSDRQYDALAEVTENGSTHSSYHPHVVM